jgi:drug/metabolite transporter (DMT)-like permease
VLSASLLHAIWNLSSKRAADVDSTIFVWTNAAVSMVVFFPLVIYVFVVNHPTITSRDFIFFAGTGCLHTIYFLALQRGYRTSDMSVVYPIARGSGPVIASALAIALFQAKPAPPAVLGIALVGVGVFTIGIPRLNSGKLELSKGLRAGLLVGIIISIYTIWDSYAIAKLGISPIVQDWSGSLGRVVLLGGFAAKKRSTILAVTKKNIKAILIVGILSPLAYILVLTAYRYAPVTAVAPARELSVLFGVVLGGQILKERDRTKRFAGSVLLVIGVALVAIWN